MIKTKSTKHALIMSVMALVLCFTMLLGTTFAWFTDSVTSAGNKIVSGTLKVDLELHNTETSEWKSIKETSDPIFTYDKWEPGYTDVKLLKIENEGTLALKWKARFVSDSELSILADVIDVYVLPSETELTYPDTRDLETLGYKHVGTVRDFVNTIETTTTGNLEAGKVAYLGIALKMQESAGNDYQDKSLGNFDIQILATQYTAEDDSFGTDYDADATYPSLGDKWDGTSDDSWYYGHENDTEYTLDSAEDLASLSEIVASGVTFAGKTITLATDFDLGNKTWTLGGTFSGTLDGDGHVISNLASNGSNKIGLLNKIQNATIKNLTIDGATAEMSGGDLYAGIVAVSVAGDKNVIETVTVKNVNVKANTTGKIYAGGIVYGGDTSATMKNITVSDLTFDLQTSGDVAAGAIAARINQADSGVTLLDNFNLSNITINAKGYYTDVGGAFGILQKGNKHEIGVGLNTEIDGAKGTLTNITINANPANGAQTGVGGLIGYTYKCDPLVVKNVEITGLDIDFKGTTTRVGGVTGWEESVSRYENVTVEGSITENITTGSNSECGGFVGISYQYPKTYVNCTADVDMTTGGVVGGFVGTSCTNAWGSQTDAYTGCIAKGDVAGDVAGGFAGKGWLKNKTTLAMTNVESYGNVTGKAHAGGLIGFACDQYVVIKDSIASENVVGTASGTTVGGIIGTGWGSFKFENVTSYLEKEVG